MQCSCEHVCLTGVMYEDL